MPLLNDHIAAFDTLLVDRIQTDPAKVPPQTLTIVSPTLTGPTISGTTAIGAGATLTTPSITAPSRLDQTVDLAVASGALTVASSGHTLICAVDAAITLPLATVGAGVNFRIMCGVASSGTGLTITRAGSDTIETRTNAAGGTAIAGATTITNTGATDVVGDFQWLVSDGVSKWRAIGVLGTWA